MDEDWQRPEDKNHQYTPEVSIIGKFVPSTGSNDSIVIVTRLLGMLCRVGTQTKLPISVPAATA
jgi:hypothetical protein